MTTHCLFDEHAHSFCPTLATRSVLELKYQHRHTWRNNPQRYWLRGLCEEVAELALALCGLHRHSPDIELRQIAAIALNWLEMREALDTTEQKDTPETIPISAALLESHVNILQQLIEHIATLPACEVCDSCSDVQFLSAYAAQALQTFRAAMEKATP